MGMACVRKYMTCMGIVGMACVMEYMTCMGIVGMACVREYRVDRPHYCVVGIPLLSCLPAIVSLRISC